MGEAGRISPTARQEAQTSKPHGISWRQRMLRSAIWSAIATVAFAGLQVYGIKSQGLGWPAIRAEAPYWLALWPGFFFTILVLPLAPRLFIASRSWGESLAGGRKPKV